jgi:hypothetical protein
MLFSNLLLSSAHKVIAGTNPSAHARCGTSTVPACYLAVDVNVLTHVAVTSISLACNLLEAPHTPLEDHIATTTRQLQPRNETSSARSGLR